MSQAELAEALGMSKVMISFLEVQSDHIAPTREFAKRIEEALARLESAERERVA